MKPRRKRYSADFKAKVALEAILAARAAAGCIQTAVSLPGYSPLGTWQQTAARPHFMHPCPLDPFNIKATEMRGKERIT